MDKDLLRVILNVAAAALTGYAYDGWEGVIAAVVGVLGGLVQEKPRRLLRPKAVPLLIFALAVAPIAEAQNVNTIQGRKMVRAQLLTAVAATDDGVWIDVESFAHSTVHIKGITTATVKVNVSNSPTKPANNTHEIEAASLTADGIVALDLGVRWVKARVSAYTSGTINAYLEGVQ